MDTNVLFEQFYYSRPSFVGGTAVFHGLCRRHIPPGSRILEIGPGPANATSAFVRTLGELIGVDVSAAARRNPALAQALTYDGQTLPFASASFDACVSNYVLEHIASPETHFREVARVLRPGGVYCFRTPNLWHYAPLLSALLPHCLHLRLANWLRGYGAEADDPYPTRYRANTRSAVIRYARRGGLEIEQLDYLEAEPSYGRAHPLLFWPMMLYERLVNATGALAPFRMNIFAVLRRPPGPRPRSSAAGPLGAASGPAGLAGQGDCQFQEDNHEHRD